jgi:hypothetical protein
MIPDENTVRNSNAPEKALTVVDWISTRAIEGKGPFLSAEELAREYLNDSKYKNNAERVDALIKWESAKNFSTGFVSGLGGLATLPASVPASLGASWVVQARMAGAIAVIHGHDILEDRVRAMILLSLIGNAAMDELRRLGVEIGHKAARTILRQISGRLVMEINRAVGFRLITKSGQKGVISLSKIVPLAGGVVGGFFDGIACRTVGRVADSLFSPATPKRN